jgi:hypothetical protein
MKFIIIFLMALSLSSCAVPVQRKFPELPDNLTKACSELQMIPKDTTKLSEVLVIVTSNYSQYHQCSFKVEAFQQWYNQQKEIFESVK